jgi:nitrogen fixation NifU-like protein
MTESVKGKTLGEVEDLFGRFHQMLTGPSHVKADATGLGKLAAFAGVREFPVRVKCATLAWHTLDSALHGKQEASTE